MRDRIRTPGEGFVQHPDDRERAEQDLRKDRAELERRRLDHGRRPSAAAGTTRPPTSAQLCDERTCSIVTQVAGSIDRVSRLGYTPKTSSSASTGASTA